MKSNIKHSITLYGLGRKFIQGKWSFEEILQIAKNLGGDGIEIVAPQMVPNHPEPTDEWIGYFKESCVKYGLEPVCYSIYIDNGKHRGRLLSETERMTSTLNEMEAAKKMGFKIVRTIDSLMPATMEKLLPYAEELDIHLAIEMHGPWKPTNPLFQWYYELFERKKSEHIGVVMDFSSFTSGAPATFLNHFPDDLCHKELLREINKLYITTEVPEDELIKILYDKGGDKVDEAIARDRIFSIPLDSHMGTIYDRTHPDYDGFRRFLKYSKYMHGKFKYVDENLECIEIDYPRFVKIMKEEGYKGYIASEYEGGKLDESISEEDQIILHIKMLEKLWAQS
jgi:sugar phosphate isomerase/epimerase